MLDHPASDRLQMDLIRFNDRDFLLPQPDRSVMFDNKTIINNLPADQSQVHPRLKEQHLFS